MEYGRGLDDSKSYANEIHLKRALTKLGFINDRFLVARNRAGRFTAIFPVSNITTGDMARYARHGFMTLG